MDGKVKYTVFKSFYGDLARISFHARSPNHRTHSLRAAFHVFFRHTKRRIMIHSRRVMSRVRAPRCLVPVAHESDFIPHREGFL